MNKKEALLHAAVHLMGEQGFEKTSVSQIVKEAGVAQGTFYLYFQSKSALVLSIAQSIIEDLLSEAMEFPDVAETSLEEFLRSLTDLTFSMTRKHKKLIGFVYSGTAYYSSFNEWELLYEPYYAWLSEKLRYYQEQHLLKSAYETDHLANYLVGLLEHGAEQVHLTEAKGFTEEISKSTLHTFILEALKAS